MNDNKQGSWGQRSSFPLRVEESFSFLQNWIGSLNQTCLGFRKGTWAGHLKVTRGSKHPQKHTGCPVIGRSLQPLAPKASTARGPQPIPAAASRRSRSPGRHGSLLSRAFQAARSTRRGAGSYRPGLRALRCQRRLKPAASRPQRSWAGPPAAGARGRRSGRRGRP